MRRLFLALVVTGFVACGSANAVAQDEPSAATAPAAEPAAPAASAGPAWADIKKLIPPDVTEQLRDFVLQGYLGGLSDRELELVKVRPEDCARSAFCNGVDPGRISAVAGVILNERAKSGANASAAWSATTAVLTLLTAAFVAWIAYQQWRTARQKLAFDLFERRTAVYDKVAQATTKVIVSGRPEDNEPLRLLHTARSEAQFLFGPEVGDYIRTVLEAVTKVGLAHTMMEAERLNGKAPGDNYNYPQMNRDAMMEIASAEQTLALLLTKYAGFTEGLPPNMWQSLAKFFRNRSRQRKGQGA